jgi:hypothetical protein
MRTIFLRKAVRWLVGGFFYWIIVRHTAVRLTNNKWALWRSFAKVPNFRKAENRNN